MTILNTESCESSYWQCSPERNYKGSSSGNSIFAWVLSTYWSLWHVQNGTHDRGEVVFPTHFQISYRNYIQYCGGCQHVNTTKLQKGQDTLHPISVPLSIWSQIAIDVLGIAESVKEVHKQITIIDTLKLILKNPE